MYDELVKRLWECASGECFNCSQYTETTNASVCQKELMKQAADVRPVVLCGVCELHGHCYTEDVFAFARLADENRFCAVGKVKTNGKKMEES